MPKISVIIPIYKVEIYIEKCIKSVLDQTCKDFEIILIDDKSPDNSIFIAEATLKSQNVIPFKIIKLKKNEGLSAVRNIGIANSIGKYLLFLDSDDWIEREMLNKLLDSAEKNQLDMVFCRIKQVYPDSNNYEILKSLPNAIYEGKDALIALLRGKYDAHVCKILINKFLFNEIKFMENTVYEDVLILPYLIQKARKVEFINDILYNYLQRPGSITKSFDPRLDGVLDQISVMSQSLEKKILKGEIIYLNKFLYNFIHIVSCHAVYFSSNYPQVKNTLFKSQKLLNPVIILKLSLKFRSKTIGTLLLLKLFPKLFYKLYELS